jgi:hypothetical protein
MSRLFRKGTRVFKTFFSMFDPFGLWRRLMGSTVLESGVPIQQ